MVVRWTEVGMFVPACGQMIAPGPEVVGRVVCLEILRRTGAVAGVRVDGDVAAIDWTGFDAALAAFDAAWLEPASHDVN